MNTLEEKNRGYHYILSRNDEIYSYNYNTTDNYPNIFSTHNYTVRR